MKKAKRFIFCAVALLLARCEFNNDTSRDFSTLPCIEVKNENDNIIENPGSLDFGKIESGFQVKKTIVINNRGNQKLFISDLETDNVNFTLNKTDTALSVKGFETTTLEIIYRPITADTKINARLTIASNSRTNEIFEISLAGERIISDDIILLVGKDGEYTGEVKNNGTLDLGTISLSDSTETSLTVMNALLTGLQISSIELDDEPPFSIINTAKYNLAGGEKTLFTLVFKPGIETGSFTRELYIKSSSETMPVYTITVQGVIITNTVPTIKLKKDYNLINEFSYYLFDTTPINSTNSLVFEIQNTGKEELNISDFLVDNQDDFKIDSSNTALSLKQNECTSFRVVFAPSSLGSKKTAKVSISSNDTNNPVFNFYCSGYSCEEQYSQVEIMNDDIQLENNKSHDLGSTTVSMDIKKKYIIKNTGTKDLQVFNISVDDTVNFEIITNDTDNVIKPGESTTFMLICTPDEVKTYSTALRITTDSKENSSFCLNVSAQSFPSDSPKLAVYQENSVVENASNYFFPDTTVNNGSTFNIKLKNTGAENLIITSATVNSLGKDFFILSKTVSNYTLKQNEALSLTIFFMPKADKNYDGVLTILTNDPLDNGEFVITLNGQGLGLPSYKIYYNGADITNERSILYKSNNGGILTITIKNTSNVELEIDDIVISGDDSKHFILDTSNISTFIPPGSESNINLLCSGSEVTVILKITFKDIYNDFSIQLWHYYP